MRADEYEPGIADGERGTPPRRFTVDYLLGHEEGAACAWLRERGYRPPFGIGTAQRMRLAIEKADQNDGADDGW